MVIRMSKTAQQARNSRPEIEPPVADELFDEEVDVVDGDYDREFWAAYARDMLDIDPDVIETKPTGWLVGRCSEEITEDHK